MAPRRSRRLSSLAIKDKDKGKAVVSTVSSDEIEEISPANSSSTASSQDHAKDSKPKARRFFQSTGSSKKKLKLGTPTHSIPPVPTQVPETPQPPIEWFRNFELYGKWMDWFSNKPIGYCDQVDLQLFDEMSLPSLQQFRNSACFNLLNTGTISYPRLTRLFYLNLISTHSEKGVILESLVAGVKITVTANLLVKLFDLDPRCLSEDYPPKNVCTEQARTRFLLPSSVKIRQLTYTSLKLEPKIIFLLLVRCIVPKEHSKELVTDRLLEMLYLILSDFKLDTPSLIAEHMLRAISSSRNTSLPYSNLLPVIFREFNVPLEHEETVLTGPSLINEKTLQRMDITKTAEGNWKFVKDLTSEELKGLPDLKLKASHASSSSAAQDQLIERVQTLEVDLLETREQMIALGLRYNMLTDMFNQLTDRFSIYEEIILKQQEEKMANQQDSAQEEHKTQSPLASLAKVAADFASSSGHTAVDKQSAEIEEVQADQDATVDDPKDVAADDGQLEDNSAQDPSTPSTQI